MHARTASAGEGDISRAGTPQLPAAVVPSADVLLNSIKRLQPRVEPGFASDLSKYIQEFSQKYGTDPYRSIAIAMQESSLRDISRRETVINKNGEVKSGYTDIGVWQFHSLTIKYFKLSVPRLLTDLRYATEQHVLLLSIKLRECAVRGKDAWGCYHSRTPKYFNKYVKQVNRYYNIINPE